LGRRAYCWRVGAVLDLEEGEVCPECGSSSHGPYERDDCGDFVAGPLVAGSEASTPRQAGVHCVLPVGHPGPCAPTAESVVEPIMES
jgi:hypothetical protein